MGVNILVSAARVEPGLTLWLQLHIATILAEGGAKEGEF